MISILIRSLAVTLAVELALGAALGLRGKNALTTVFLMNFMTNPPVVYLVTLTRKLWMPQAAFAVLLGLELLVWLGEAGVLHRRLGLPGKRAAVLSAVLNGASYFVGCLL